VKVTVSTKAKSLKSELDPRFGHSNGFILFDTDTRKATYLDNSAQRNLVWGPGIKAAQIILEAGTEAIVTGQLGPKAAKILENTGVKILECSRGTVRDAIQAFVQGKLSSFGKDKVQSGPGKMGG
jgi:predicted Fe-Mo cluster-binding NifX family protein